MLLSFSFLATSIYLLHFMQFLLEHGCFCVIFFHEIAESMDLSFAWRIEVGIVDLGEESLVYCMNRRRVGLTTIRIKCKMGGMVLRRRKGGGRLLVIGKLDQNPM